MKLAIELEDDLRWREVELASFKRVVSASIKGSVRENALLRAMIALLYAHFEGFCQFAWSLYLQAIEEQKPLRQTLKDPLACLSLNKEFSKVRGNTSAESLLDFFRNQITTLLNEPATFPEPLTTDSNLWPDLYCDNMHCACLPQGEIVTHRTRIKSLVSRRNDIAHGQKVGIRDLKEYLQYEKSALIVMHDLAIAIIDAIEGKTYLCR